MYGFFPVRNRLSSAMLSRMSWNECWYARISLWISGVWLSTLMVIASRPESMISCAFFLRSDAFVLMLTLSPAFFASLIMRGRSGLRRGSPPVMPRIHTPALPASWTMRMHSSVVSSCLSGTTILSTLQ